MQESTIKVNDDVISQITKDKNLELNPYFYERRDKLEKELKKICKQLNNISFLEVETLVPIKV